MYGSVNFLLWLHAVIRFAIAELHCGSSHSKWRAQIADLSNAVFLTFEVNLTCVIIFHCSRTK